MRATFKGTNGSAGFRTGTDYVISTRIADNQLHVIAPHTRVPYSSLEAFLRNWEILPEVDETKVEPKIVTRVLNSKNLYEVSMATGLDQTLIRDMHKDYVKRGDWIEVTYTKGVPGSTVLKNGKGEEIGLE